jgi:hypothetical protein
MMFCFQGESRSVPWKSILTCVPMWAILVTQCGTAWLFYTQLTELPTYMNNILQFEIKQVSIYSLCDETGGSTSVPLVLRCCTLCYSCQGVDNV